MTFSPGVRFGSLDLTGYPYSIIRDEGDDGAPVNVYESLASDLRDGALVSRTRVDNREVSRLVSVEGTDLRSVAESVAALHAECEKPMNVLSLDPGDGWAPVAVFQTFTAQMTQESLPGAEAANVRLYRVTWPALPYPRSVDPFVAVGATSSGTTTTVVNDCSSATNWTAAGSTLHSAAGELYLDVDSGLDTNQPSMTYTPGSPIDMTGLPFLKVAWRIGGALAGPYDQGPRVFVDGLELSRISTASDGTYYSSTYACPDTSVATLKIQAPRTSAWGTGTTASGTFNVNEVDKSDVAPSTGTARQKLTQVEVPGSARTPVSLSVQHETSALGDVIVYTGSALTAGYLPPLSTWAASAGSTASTNVSGKSWNLSSGQNFDFPASLLPSGSYQLVVRISGLSNAPITATATTRFGSTDVDPVQTISLPSVTTSSYDLVPVGTFVLPPSDLPAGSVATVRINITAGGTLDEAWLFYLPDDGSAHLSVLACGTASPSPGGSSNRAWLDCATVDRPFPAAFVGTESDRSDSRAPWGDPTNWDEHVMSAGANSVFIVTPNATDAEVSVTGYAYWHTHPAA